MSYRLLMVDDDQLILDTSAQLLRQAGYFVDTAQTEAEALAQFRKAPDLYSLVILDYKLGESDGAVVAESLRQIRPEVFILMYSGDSSRSAMRSSWAAGAVGFVDKGGPVEEFFLTIASWCKKHEETIAVVSTERDATENESLIASLQMVGRSKPLVEIAKKVERYRQSTQPVLITGETGTGKELVARALHRGDGPFVALNCAAYKGSTDLLESELFGYEKGAFTGADRERKGALESANSGTVFLDEVHHLSLTAQAKLLRVLQEKKIRRVGSAKEISVGFRLIAAAKPDLSTMCEKDQFMRDLYHRLNVLAVEIPPLRERPEDIEPLVSYFCRKYQVETGEKKTFRLRALQYLETYNWPGNVRELENLVYRLLTDCPQKVVGPEQLDASFFVPAKPSELSYHELKKRQEAEELTLIQNVLSSSESKFHAARRLQLSPSTLHSIMKRMGLYQTDGAEMSP